MKFYLKKKLNKPDIIFFDLDNTMYAYQSSHEYAIKKIKSYFFKNYNLSQNTFANFYEKAKNIVKHQLKNTASSHSRILYFQKMFEIMNLGSQVKKSLLLENMYWKFFFKKTYLFPGTVNFLKNLKKNNISTGIITDLTTQIQFKKLIHFKIYKYFDSITTSEEVMCDKPKKKIFIQAKKKFTNKKNIWMIGDNLLRDIKGSKDSLRATTFHKINNSYPRYKNLKPDYAFKNFSEINNFFKKLIEDAK